MGPAWTGGLKFELNVTNLTQPNFARILQQLSVFY